MARKVMPPIHPGEILLADFLEPMGIDAADLARGAGLPISSVDAILQGTGRIDAETSLRLARFFGMTESFWLSLQVGYDIETEKDRLGDRLKQEVHRYRRVGATKAKAATGSSNRS